VVEQKSFLIEVVVWDLQQMELLKMKLKK